MTAQELIGLVGEWEGHRVGTVGPGPGPDHGEAMELWVELFPVKGPGRCGICGTLCASIHDVTERFVRELPVFGKACWLLLHRRRVFCKRCGGPRVERLSWLEPWARHTTRFAQSVARLCKMATVKDAAQHYGIDWKTAKAIDKRYLEKELGPPNLAGLRVVIMDAFAIRKGQRYATVFLEPTHKEVLWVCRGHGREEVRSFFEALGEEGREQLEAVVMDMDGAFEAEVRSQCPKAEIVFDLYHVVAKYSHEVINRVRLQEIERLERDAPERDLIKGSRWLLLRNPRNLNRSKDRVRLKELLDANRKLTKVHLLREDLKHLWDYTYPGAARRFWTQWYHRAIHSRIEPLKRFARRLKPYLAGIIAHCKYPFHTSLLEGINNTIKVIKRKAYGFHDDEYFFLKIRQAFPGNRR